MLYYFNMSRVLAVPDVHGNKIVLENAKVAYEKHKPDFVVFVGDYVDSHVDGNSWIQQQEQLKAILDWKKELNKEIENAITYDRQITLMLCLLMLNKNENKLYDLITKICSISYLSLASILSL